jgi:integration host factor subunit beta
MLTNGDTPFPKTSETGKLTKADLIEEVSRVTGLQWKEASVIVERILNSMVRAIERGEKVEIRGFGSFRTRQRQARVVIRKPARRWTCRPKEFRFSNPAKNSATWWMAHRGQNEKPRRTERGEENVLPAADQFQTGTLMFRAGSA